MKMFWIFSLIFFNIFVNTAFASDVTGENLLYNSKFEDPGYIYDWRVSACSGRQIADGKNVFSGTYSALFKVKPGCKVAYIENKCPRIRVIAGETYEFSVMAKGHGKIQMVFVQYGDTPMHLKGLGWVKSKEFSLNGKWQRFVYRHTFNKQNLLEFSCRILMKGSDTQVYLDEAELRRKLKHKASFKIKKNSFMAYPGQRIKFRVGVEYTDSQCSENLSITQENYGKCLKAVYKNGEVSLTIPQNSISKTYKLNIFDRTSALGKHVFIEVFSKAQYDAVKQAAAKLTPPAGKLNVLVLGDSLSDLFRGQNYVDWLKFWAPQLKWYNYGVRGDYVSRILSRLKGKRVWGMRRFKNVLQHSPDLVFIFCGHNDSRLTKRSEFKKMMVPLPRFKKDLTSLIHFLRKKKPNVKIALMTPVKSNFAKSEAIWLKKGKRSDLFGKPEIMRQFQQVVQNVAKKEKCDLIDVFKASEKYPQNAKLFQPDGVHLNSTGNYFLALTILQKLGKSGYWTNCGN